MSQQQISEYAEIVFAALWQTPRAINREIGCCRPTASPHGRARQQQVVDVVSLWHATANRPEHWGIPSAASHCLDSPHGCAEEVATIFFAWPTAPTLSCGQLESSVTGQCGECLAAAQTAAWWGLNAVSVPSPSTPDYEFYDRHTRLH